MVGDAVAAAGARDEEPPGPALAATAVSLRRTVMAAVNTLGFVVGVRLLDDAVRMWDSATLEQRVTAVSSVAHDRYLAGLGAVDGRYPSMDAVARAEADLDF